MTQAQTLQARLGAISPSPEGTPDSEERVRAVAAAAIDRKAQDIRVLELTDVSDFTDYFVICNGANARQVSAIAEAVERRLRSFGARPLHLEGSGRGQWVLLDYGDVVVHVFDPKRRELYRLERLWSDAPDRTAELASDGGPVGHGAPAAT